ncbi:unnamed protein product [Symbiodinium microadriaticum]|nr:unnamed protein product [Symbiodinium microadriaticum]
MDPLVRKRRPGTGNEPATPFRTLEKVDGEVGLEQQYQTALSQGLGTGNVRGPGMKPGEASPGTLELGEGGTGRQETGLPVASPFHSERIQAEVALMRSRPVTLDGDAAKLGAEADEAALGDRGNPGASEPDYAAAFWMEEQAGIPEEGDPDEVGPELIPVGEASRDAKGGITGAWTPDDEAYPRGVVGMGRGGKRSPDFVVRAVAATLFEKEPGAETAHTPGGESFGVNFEFSDVPDEEASDEGLVELGDLREVLGLDKEDWDSVDCFFSPDLEGSEFEIKGVSATGNDVEAVAGRVGKVTSGMLLKNGKGIAGYFLLLIIVKPPYLLVELGLLGKDDRWWVRKALYGLPTSPRDWGRYRDAEFQKVRIEWQGQEYCLVQTKTDDALWLLRTLDSDGMGPIAGVLIVYVDDLAMFAPEGLAKEFIRAIQSRWKTSEPEWLGVKPVTFCGIELSLLPTGYRFRWEAALVAKTYPVMDQCGLLFQSRYWALDQLQKSCSEGNRVLKKKQNHLETKVDRL